MLAVKKEGADMMIRKKSLVFSLLMLFNIVLPIRAEQENVSSSNDGREVIFFQNEYQALLDDYNGECNRDPDGEEAKQLKKLIDHQSGADPFYSRKV